MKFDEAFVLMPHGSHEEYSGGVRESDFVYHEIIRSGIMRSVEGGPTPAINRETDRSQGGSITASLVRSIVNADVVVVDVTGRNSNVFLELGMRYATRSKVTILIAQEGTPIPFDIKDYRYIQYSRFEPEAARAKIAAFIREGLSGHYHSDSVVFDVFREMSVIIPGVAQSYGQAAPELTDSMSWDDYMQRVDRLCSYLRPPFMEGHFVPDAVLGITNGGMIVAELIGKNLFGGTQIPILSLWAHRATRKRGPMVYFDNGFNELTVKGISSFCSEKHPDTSAMILLLDDHAATGKTAMQAIHYLESRLDRPTIVFAPLVASLKLLDVDLLESYLPYEASSADGRRLFGVSKKEFAQHVQTKREYFPYLKKRIRTHESK